MTCGEPGPRLVSFIMTAEKSYPRLVSMGRPTRAATPALRSREINSVKRDQDLRIEGSSRSYPSSPMLRYVFLLPFSLCLSTSLLVAAGGPAFTDPKEATAKDPDFVTQGEYAGNLGGKPVGVQLVAEGSGKFAAVLYPGGLPGAGFSGDKATRLKGTATGGQITLPGLNGTMAAGKITFPGGTLSKLNRESPTLGAKAPAGAIVLFDGKSPDAFQEGKLDGETLMQGVTSKQLWKNFSLHIEFKTPYMPEARGQGRGNSGCYLQGRYEVQMLDSFGLEGENNECGGIYTIGSPIVNMAFPPLSWQTYDIEYTQAVYDASGKKTANARTSVKHNGVIVQDNIELDHATTASPLKEGPTPGPIHLQDHGTPVRYRNIWVVEK